MIKIVPSSTATHSPAARLYRYALQGAVVTNIAIALMFGLLICSQNAKAEPPVVDSHARAASDLLSVMNVEKQMASGAEIMADLMVKQNAMLGPYKGVLLKWAASFMTLDSFGPRLVALYEASFTEPELRDMAAFYKTATGQKALTVMPELTRRMADLGATAAKEHAQELEPLIRARSEEIEKLSAKP